MIGLIVKVAGAATAVGFAAGVYAHRKANNVKDNVKERFSTMETQTITVRVPKGTDLNRCQMRVLVPLEDDD